MTTVDQRAQRLKARPSPVKESYRSTPDSAVVTMRASDRIETLMKLTDRYCVVGRTISGGAPLQMMAS